MSKEPRFFPPDVISVEDATTRMAAKLKSRGLAELELFDLVSGSDPPKLCVYQRCRRRHDGTPYFDIVSPSWLRDSPENGCASGLGNGRRFPWPPNDDNAPDQGALCCAILGTSTVSRLHVPILPEPPPV